MAALLITNITVRQCRPHPTLSCSCVWNGTQEPSTSTWPASPVPLAPPTTANPNTRGACRCLESSNHRRSIQHDLPGHAAARVPVRVHCCSPRTQRKMSRERTQDDAAKTAEASWSHVRSFESFTSPCERNTTSAVFARRFKGKPWFFSLLLFSRPSLRASSSMLTDCHRWRRWTTHLAKRFPCVARTYVFFI